METVRKSALGFRLLASPVWGWGKWILLALLGLRLLFWALTFPNPDEAYYWLWGQHPAFSYYDHPPFHAWVQGIMAAGLGRSNLVLRLPNLVSSGLLAIAAYHTCRYLYGDDGGDRFWLVILLGASSPLFFLFLAMAWHDHWLVTFGVLSSLGFVRFMDDYLATGQGKARYLYGAALFLGLAGLCKYNALFIGLGFLATLLTEGRSRRLWRDPRLYLALGLLLLVLSPIALWNWQHDFVSFRFYGDRTASGGGLQLNLLQPLVFLVLCGLILGPIQAWGILRLLRHPAPMQSALVRPTVYPRLALWIFALSTLTFVALSLVSVAVYYWNILAYPLLFPLLANQFYHPRPQPGPALASIPPPLKRRRQLAVAQGLGLLAATALVFHYTVIPLTAYIGQADRDSAALYGWPQVATAVMAQAAALEQPLLFTTDYRSASALAYQLDQPGVMALSGRLDQFDFLYPAAALQGRDGVLLGESWHPICPAHLALFERTSPPQTLVVKRFGRILQTYQIVTGYGLKGGPELDPLSPAYPLAFSPDGERCTPD